MPKQKLTQQQRDQYRDEGYTVVRRLISPEEAAYVRTRLMDLLEGTHDWPDTHFQVIQLPQTQNAEPGNAKVEFVPIGVQRPAQREQVFKKIADHPNLQSAMAQLLGGPVKLFTDQALIKNRAISGQSFYHQDSDYWRIPHKQGCNAWIALDEFDAEASALAIMPGTHQSWELMPHERYYDEPAQHHAPTGKPYMRLRIPLDQIDFSKEVLLPMSVGDAAFFTNFTWHRSEPNKSGVHKCAYAIAYQLQ